MSKKIIKSVSKKSKIVKKSVKIEKVSAKVAQQPNSSYISKINRISGQVGGVKKMIEEGKYCVEILTQLKAVRSAIKALEAEILEIHLEECVASLVSGSAAQKGKKITEMKNIFTKFE